MTLKRKASLLFMIGVLLYVLLSMFVPTEGGISRMLWFNVLLVSVPAFLVPSIIFRRREHFPLFKAPRISHILIALALGLGCILLNVAMGMLDSAITYGMEINSTALDVQESVAGADIVTLLVTIAIIPAISEEFFMRGSLLEAWRRTSPIAAMILTSVIFALLHASPSNIPIYFAMGMLFAVVYNITRNVWLSVIIHFVNNLISVIAAIAAMNLDPSELAESAAEVEELTRWGYVSEFLTYLAIALAVIIPMVILLRNSCRKHGIGLYAVEAPEAIPEEAVFAEGGFAPVQDRAVTLPEEPCLEPAKGEPKGAGKLLAEPMLWIGIAVLLVLNAAAAAIEFGLIDMAEMLE